MGRMPAFQSPGKCYGSSVCSSRQFNYTAVQNRTQRPQTTEQSEESVR